MSLKRDLVVVGVAALVAAGAGYGSSHTDRLESLLRGPQPTPAAAEEPAPTPSPCWVPLTSGGSSSFRAGQQPGGVAVRYGHLLPGKYPIEANGEADPSECVSP